MILSMLNNSPRAGLLRGLAIVVVVVAWLGIGGVGGMSIGKLQDVQQNDSAAFLPTGAESTRAAELAAGFRQQDTLPALVVAEGDGALTPAQLAAMQDFAGRVAGLPLGTGRTIGDVLAAPAAAIPSQDGQAVLVTVVLKAAAARELVGQDPLVNVAVAQLRDAAASLADQGLSVHVTGPAGAIADLVTAFGGIDTLLILVALVVVFVILVLVYRSPSLPFTVLLTSMFALAGAALAVYRLAADGALVLNGQSQGILFILVVGASTDYSLLLVARYREELRWVAPAAPGHGARDAGLDRADRGQRGHRGRRAAVPAAVRPRLQPQPRTGRGDRDRRGVRRVADPAARAAAGRRPTRTLDLLAADARGGRRRRDARRGRGPRAPRGARRDLGPGRGSGGSSPAPGVDGHRGPAGDRGGLGADVPRPGHRRVRRVPHQGRLGGRRTGARPALRRRAWCSLRPSSRRRRTCLG